MRDSIKLFTSHFFIKNFAKTNSALSIFAYIANFHIIIDCLRLFVAL